MKITWIYWVEVFVLFNLFAPVHVSWWWTFLFVAADIAASHAYVKEKGGA